MAHEKSRSEGRLSLLKEKINHKGILEQFQVVVNGVAGGLSYAAGEVITDFFGETMLPVLDAIYFIFHEHGVVDAFQKGANGLRVFQQFNDGGQAALLEVLIELNLKTAGIAGHVHQIVFIHSAQGVMIITMAS